MSQVIILKTQMKTSTRKVTFMFTRLSPMYGFEVRRDKSFVTTFRIKYLSNFTNGYTLFTTRSTQVLKKIMPES